MRCTQWLARLVFALLLVTSVNAVPDDIGTAESVVYLKTLLVQHLDDKREFSRHAIQYLALTGQESIPFVDNLAGNYPLPRLSLIQQFLHSLPECSEELSLLGRNRFNGVPINQYSLDKPACAHMAVSAIA